MMSILNKWKIIFIKDAQKDLEKLDGSKKSKVLKAIDKVSYNPLSSIEGGYGKPLGNKNNSNLNGFLKIKLKKDGIRVVYQLIRTEKEMRIVIIGIREDSIVYKEAYQRIKKHCL